MKRIAEDEQWNLKTGQLIAQIDANKAAILLMRFTRLSDSGISLDRIKILFQHRFKIFDCDRIQTYLLEDGDILKICLSKQSGIDRKGS